jgi:uncharacterized protein YjbJ (UPF0337 family)
MDKDRIKGKMKDVAGRVQRQTGEWTGDKEQQIKGASKQVEGKVQNIAGKVKDAMKPKQDEELDEERTREGTSNPPRRKTA